MTDEQAAAEMRKLTIEMAVRRAPILAAKHGLSVERVRRILTEYATDDKMQPKPFWPAPAQDSQTPWFDRIAAQEQIGKDVVAAVIFDDRLLEGSERE